MTVDHDDVYKLAARLRVVALTIDGRGGSQGDALRELADQLDAFGDRYAAQEMVYAESFTAANDEIVRLRTLLAELTLGREQAERGG